MWFLHKFRDHSRSNRISNQASLNFSVEHTCSAKIMYFRWITCATMVPKYTEHLYTSRVSSWSCKVQRDGTAQEIQIYTLPSRRLLRNQNSRGRWKHYTDASNFPTSLQTIICMYICKQFLECELTGGSSCVPKGSIFFPPQIQILAPQYLRSFSVYLYGDNISFSAHTQSDLT